MLDSLPTKSYEIPLPGFKEITEELESTGWAIELYDTSWNLAWISAELRSLIGATNDYGFGRHIFDVYRMPVWQALITGASQLELLRQAGGYVLYDSEIEVIPVELERLGVSAVEPPPIWSTNLTLDDQANTQIQCLTLPIDRAGERVAIARIYGPGLPASLLNVAISGDERTFKRMHDLATPGRRPAAIMFIDIEGSSLLARRLPSHIYFELIAEITNCVYQTVGDHDGLISKHLGDGASAFFVPEEHGGETGSIRAAIVSARESQQRIGEVAEQLADSTGIETIRGCQTNIGIHWGETLYIGQIGTGARMEVTALGDEVNECARIESVAKQGSILASKTALERLSNFDAAALEIDTQRITYSLLRDLAEEYSKASVEGINIPVAKI